MATMLMLAVFGFLMRMTVGGLLVVAGTAKLSAGQAWRIRWLQSFETGPQWLIPPAAWAIPMAEVVVGTALMLGVFGRTSVAAAAALLGMVTLPVIFSLMRKNPVRCGCMGRFGDQLVSWNLVIRNLALSAGLVLIFGLDVSQIGVARFSGVVQVIAVAMSASAATFIGTTLLRHSMTATTEVAHDLM